MCYFNPIHYLNWENQSNFLIGHRFDSSKKKKNNERNKQRKKKEKEPYRTSMKSTSAAVSYWKVTLPCLVVERGGSNCTLWGKSSQVHLIVIREWPKVIKKLLWKFFFRPLTLSKRETPPQVFSCKYCETLKSI